MCTGKSHRGRRVIATPGGRETTPCALGTPCPAAVGPTETHYTWHGTDTIEGGERVGPWSSISHQSPSSRLTGLPPGASMVGTYALDKLLRMQPHLHLKCGPRGSFL